MPGGKVLDHLSQVAACKSSSDLSRSGHVAEFEMWLPLELDQIQQRPMVTIKISDYFSSLEVDRVLIFNLTLLNETNEK